jgi:phospholipid/cholesterol/gamma-HCH transport system permease protein
MSKSTSTLTQYHSSKHELVCQGEWTLATILTLKNELKQIHWPARGKITVNGRAITKMDSAGAWLLHESFRKAGAEQCEFQLDEFSEQYMNLLALLESRVTVQLTPPPRQRSNLVVQTGKYFMTLVHEFRDYLAFIGQLFTEVLQVIRQPRRFRLASLTNVIDMTGVRALPIIALLSFMIGVVIAYQMGVQLRNYGANVYIVDFLGLAVLREFGPLLTAIMVSGRTGSAFTAQLGIMKINQEIDALNTMGVTPGELLLLPRIIGLVIVMPLLVIWADLFGVIGGMLMAQSMLGVTAHEFIVRFQHVIPLRTLVIGLCKAPVFALLIASIGCFEGMRVFGSADSVGRQTTRSVVLAIFFIILTDAAFSILLSKAHL